MPTKRSRQLDLELFADPALKAAIAARQPPPALVRRPLEESETPWGSAFRIAVDVATHLRHASADRFRTECDLPCSPLVLADGMIGPYATWLKPNCPPCLQIVEAWEAARL